MSKVRIQQYRCKDKVWYKVEEQSRYGRWHSVYSDLVVPSAALYRDVTYDTVADAEAALEQYISNQEPEQVTSVTVYERELT